MEGPHLFLLLKRKCHVFERIAHRHTEGFTMASLAGCNMDIINHADYDTSLQIVVFPPLTWT